MLTENRAARFTDVVALLIACVLTAPASAQAPTITLGNPTASFAEEFSSIGWIRELNDGTVMVIDTKDNLLKRVDPRSAQVETISRKGQGPGEYLAVLGLFRLRGDTSLVYDGNGKRMYFNGVTWLRTDPPPARIVGPYGADTLGHLLLKPVILTPPGTMGTINDSQVVVLASVDFTRLDTVARIRTGTTTRGTFQSPDGRSMGTITPAFMNAGTQVDIFPDGWLALAFPEPYHVEWRNLAGVWTKGPTIPIASVPVDDRQRRAFVEWQATEAGVARRDTAAVSRPGWPASLPAFVNTPLSRTSSVRAIPDGRLLVQRAPNAVAPGTHYDIIDRAGKLAATLSIPADQRVVGFGKGSIYTATTDSDGLQQLRRYAWQAWAPNDTRLSVPLK